VRASSASTSTRLCPAAAAGTTKGRLRQTPSSRREPSRAELQAKHPRAQDTLAARLERDFGMIGGDIFHGALTLDQLFSARPVLGYADYRSPVRGLYLVRFRCASWRRRDRRAGPQRGRGRSSGTSDALDAFVAILRRPPKCQENPTSKIRERVRGGT